VVDVVHAVDFANQFSEHITCTDEHQRTTRRTDVLIHFGGALHKGTAPFISKLLALFECDLAMACQSGVSTATCRSWNKSRLLPTKIFGMTSVPIALTSFSWMVLIISKDRLRVTA